MLTQRRQKSIMRKKVKRVFILIGFMETGGAQRVSSILTEYLVENGIAVKVVALKEAASGGYKIDDRAEYVVINKYGHDAGALNTISGLRKEIKIFDPEVVLSMGVPTGALYAVPAMIGLKNKLVISERADPAHFRGRKVTKLLAHTLLNFADGYVFQTNDARDYYNKHIRKHSEVIFNPLGVLPEVYRGERKKTIVSIGRLAKAKNHKLLINAFTTIANKYPEYRLMIYGEGPERGSLETLIEDNKMNDRIKLKGQIAGDVIWNEIADAGVFVLSSNDEGMPNALIEAMAMGLPCISTDCPCGGPKMLIDDNVNGCLIPVGDINALYKKLEYMLDNNEFRYNISIKAEEIRKKLAIDNICSKWLKYFENVVQFEEVE